MASVPEQVCCPFAAPSLPWLRSRHPLNHPENQLTKSLARFPEDPDRCAMVAALVVVHTFRYGLLVPS